MKIVKVDWADATGGIRVGWRPLRSMTAPPVKVESVGFLIRNDDVVAIVPHLAEEDGDGEIAIPAGWVTKIIELGPRGKPIKAGSGISGG